MTSVLSPNVRIVAGDLVPLGFQQMALTATAAHLSPPADARIAVIDTEVQNARWRDDGTAPTAAIGMRCIADTEFSYSGSLSAIQFVAETAGSIINVSYYK